MVYKLMKGIKMRLEERLSPNFTLAEFTVSDRGARAGLSNMPTAEHFAALKHTAKKSEEVRKALKDKPMLINSAYRSPAVNRLVGGSSTSQHCKGEAIDFISPGYGTPLQICKAIIEAGIEFDQLIYEGTWVHISFSRTRSRKQVLTAHFTRKGVTYSNGIDFTNVSLPVEVTLPETPEVLEGQEADVTVETSEEVVVETTNPVEVPLHTCQPQEVK